jgi:hypothetical protein
MLESRKPQIVVVEKCDWSDLKITIGIDEETEAIWEDFHYKNTWLWNLPQKKLPGEYFIDEDYTCVFFADRNRHLLLKIYPPEGVELWLEEEFCIDDNNFYLGPFFNFLKNRIYTAIDELRKAPVGKKCELLM